MRRRELAALFVSLAVAGFLPAYAQHTDPAPNADAQNLTFARHVDTTFTTATLDPALTFGTRLLQRCDRISASDQDVACGVTLQRSGAIGTFGVTGDGNDVITTDAEMNAVIALGVARVKVVTSISACGGTISTSIIGCGYVGGVGIVSESGLGVNLTGEELTHEFGHNQGLNHRGDAGAPPKVGNPLLQNPLGGRDEVEQTECAAYHSGGVNIGPNTPVNFAPNITCPSNRTVECSAVGGTPVGDTQLTTFFSGASAEDGCEVAPPITNDASGLFPVGVTTPVNFTATDAGSLTDTCAATVRVLDTTRPNIFCPSNIAVECTAFGGVPASDPQLAAFFAGVSATDICDATPSISNDAPVFFGLGATAVTFFAQDDSLNLRTCQATVTVADTTLPTISADVSPTALWPPNHTLRPIAATIVVSDICDPNPAVRLVSITSNEADNGLGDGDTANDIQGAAFGTDDRSFLLRSERSGKGHGRTYSILYETVDGSGNSSQDGAMVTVGHNALGLDAASGRLMPGTVIAPGTPAIGPAAKPGPGRKGRQRRSTEHQQTAGK